MDEARVENVEILIVGGGPVGLAASIELSRHEISSLLVEKHPDTSLFPKARLVSTRTMEILRSWGIQDEVERAGMPREDVLAVGVGTSLSAGDYLRKAAAIAEDAAQSPTYTYLCSQDVLEVILRRVAESAADVRFGTTMTDLRIDRDGVLATVVAGGVATRVRARYLIAADGGRSAIRERLGIAMEGPPPLGHMVSIMFDADFDFLPPGRRAALSFVRSTPGGAIEAVDNRRRWIMQTGYDPARGGSADDFTEEYCLAAVRSAIGIPGHPVDIVGVMPWLQQAAVAAEFAKNPVYLAGDAAHVATPQGGFGMNCGIQDAHNLAWKLAAVLRGEAGPRLLDTYAEERRPIAVRTVDESLVNAMITFKMMAGRLSMHEAIEQQAGRRGSEGLVLGFHYDSAAVVPDGTPEPMPADPYRTYVPTARPGHRAPHVWVSPGVSTLDLLGPAFTLLTAAGSGWAPAPGVKVVEIDSAEWAEAYGVGPEGAVLVRPDGHVGWRTRSGDHAGLEKALDVILARE
ncbi:2-polyprenyl-6-methoxyphenol hydroxylase [Herbidospora galbida]|uniref:2-polyprenyl-6-methoxyphenol hydroxylase n=1 Tax=Herbidospora galbida TaxID=2575442 RepID=A0A4U3M579_9ACTN|nr:FAD-dependent monooxygenase [Herbidospora galbida]TKK84018.1 2-polyprenyl-6-methoxyphenol hydroxylase [Herbidospora galbida]